MKEGREKAQCIYTVGEGIQAWREEGEGRRDEGMVSGGGRGGSKVEGVCLEIMLRFPHTPGFRSFVPHGDQPHPRLSVVCVYTGLRTHSLPTVCVCSSVYKICLQCVCVQVITYLHVLLPCTLTWRGEHNSLSNIGHCVGFRGYQEAAKYFLYLFIYLSIYPSINQLSNTSQGSKEAPKYSILIICLPYLFIAEVTLLRTPFLSVTITTGVQRDTASKQTCINIHSIFLRVC